MRELLLEDTNATLSDVIDEALIGNTAVITRLGKRVAVVISHEEYKRLTRAPSFGCLLTDAPLEDDDLPVRKPARLLTDADI